MHRVGRTGRTGGMQGRGDLVLLPWEYNYVRDQLNHVPLKPVTANDLANQVSEIAVRHDEDPKAFFPKPEAKLVRRFDRRQQAGRGPITRYAGQVAPRIEAIAEEIDEVMSSVIEEEEVKETFASMLGFYVGRADDLRTSRQAILEGLRNWAMEACGLSEPPYISPTFLQRLGFTDEKKKRSTSFGEKKQNRWGMRGSSGARRRNAAEARESREYEDRDRRRTRSEWPPRREVGSDDRRSSRFGSNDRFGGERRDRRSSRRDD